MDEEFCLENSKLLTFIQIPSNFKNWDEFNDYCQRNASYQIKIKTKLYGDVVYEALHLNKVQPSVFLYTAIGSLQEVFNDVAKISFEKRNISPYVLMQRFVGCFNMLNTSISQFYIQMAQETGTYDWTNKYSPCFFDREENLFFNMIAPHLNESDNPSFAEKCFKSLFLSYSCKCRYVTFFLCFLQLFSCPFVRRDYRFRFAFFADKLLSLKENVYIHHIFLEQSIVDTSVDVSDRGADANTTRLKIFFTFDDGIPYLARLDLPHKGVKFLHINIEDENGAITDINSFKKSCSLIDENWTIEDLNHIKLSSGDVSTEIFQPLIDSFNLFDFMDSGVKTIHAEKSLDVDVLHRVEIERKFFNVAKYFAYKLHLKSLAMHFGVNIDVINDGLESPIDFSQFEQDKNFLKEKLTNIDPDFSDASEEDVFELLFDSIYSKYSNVEAKEI